MDDLLQHRDLGESRRRSVLSYAKCLCGGFEAGYGVLMTMLRVGVGHCPVESQTFAVVNFGFFY
jgi:hypothetical protein